ncbi:MAG: hypothetical protein KGZ71_11380 [Desulfobulbaceae bacterium]|nr:hypothetical protein [Desulfobulbaceae bacterium]
MNINKIAASNISIYSKDVDVKKKSDDAIIKKSDNKMQTDTLQLSEEMLKLKPILERIQSGYYSDEKIVNEVAKRINFDLNQE